MPLKRDGRGPGLGRVLGVAVPYRSVELNDINECAAGRVRRLWEPPEVLDMDRAFLAERHRRTCRIIAGGGNAGLFVGPAHDLRGMIVLAIELEYPAFA